MQKTLKATEVRKQWSRFNDEVIRSGPRFVRRNRDEWAALNIGHLETILENFILEVELFIEEDNSVTASFADFDLVENGGTEEEALDFLTDELIEYAEEYQNNFNMYFNSPNRRPHFPYVLKVLSQDTKEEVKSLIRCRAGKR
ncbi:hypothetical protein [Salinicoccus luteus]|uniref:hypothetical protein n=1 Tax=Salinicoccus luteus TaxID=367840 RepID=UPI0004E1B9E5|nr:hypothetical protein [Salinicoccus luteus]